MTTAVDGNVADFKQGPFTGLYTVGDVALYLRSTLPPVTPFKKRVPQRRRFVGLTSRHLYAWIRRGMEWGELSDAPRDELILDFEDLVRLRMIAIMRSRGLPYETIRKAEDVARRLTGSRQPFVAEQMWTGSSDIFLRVSDTFIAASKYGQAAMDFLHDYLVPVHHGLEFGQNNVVVAWRPMPGVRIDPKIQFGAPCIEGTRITTETVWALYKAGDSMKRLAEMYRVDQGQIEAAIAWERRLATAA
ncbi:MAG: DUF433 domain-containing protein [Chloroflexi bacterium]|nr:DUF433 domain-containing protein [Chloroflexota bacterium]